ncbi:MAG: hypothetical protein R6V44_02005 [Paracoccaceae bacterium]
MNDTFRTFGWPATRIAETAHWAVMLRPAQPVLGALVVACKAPARSLGAAGPEAMADLAAAAAGVEAMLAATVRPAKLNWLALMMVDPDLHFHVLPRYPETREAAGVALPDAGWPGPPRLDAGRTLEADEAAALTLHLAAHWPG